jgi:DNA-binding NtrC family response regulator
MLALGRFAAASDLFGGLAAEKPGPPAWASLDGLARVFLATNRLDECRSALEKLEKSSAHDVALSSAFASRWTAITRGKLFLRLQEFEKASELLDVDLKRAIAIDDRLLSNFLRCLKAEALAGCGKFSEAGRLLLLTELQVESCTPDYRAAYNRAAGSLLFRNRDDLFSIMLARADAIWRHHGNRCASAELRHMAIERREGFASVSASSSSRVLAAISHLGHVHELAYDARLLANELIQAIRTLGCSDDVRLLVAGDERDQERMHHLWFPISDSKTNRLALRCALPSDPIKSVLLADVLRIGRAALALERFRQEERKRAALWPPDPVETEAGALFLSEEMQSLLAIARRVASANVPILLTGETGTGKEVLARLIHAYSPRAKAPFLPFNCTATPKEMLDSQLFGHRRGAFTGAIDHFQGVIRASAGGTLFLDEIGETTLDVQPKLLRFLEASEVHPVGETQPTRVDVRVIAATNADLDTLVTQGRFREDLYYRLNIVRLHVPPLRERRVEIPALAHHYLRKFAVEHQKGDLRLAEETMEFLVLYRWPGNVRQLANEMRRMAVIGEKGAVLMPEHLSPDIAASRRTIPASERTLDPTEIVVRLDQPLPAGVSHVQRAMIQYALAKCGGRVEETASLLGISRKGLYLKRLRYGLEVETTAAPELPAVEVA